MKPIGKIHYITLHASATPPSMDIGAKEIRQWHLEKDWSDIGYHFVIRRDGTLEKGLDSSLQGAHVGGHNAGNLGICLVGGIAETSELPEDNFTSEQEKTMNELVEDLLEEHPDALIMGHNGFPGHETRGCPCFRWRFWRQAFLDSLEKQAPRMPSHWFDEIDFDIEDEEQQES